MTKLSSSLETGMKIVTGHSFDFSKGSVTDALRYVSVKLENETGIDSNVWGSWIIASLKEVVNEEIVAYLIASSPDPVKSGNRKYI